MTNVWICLDLFLIKKKVMAVLHLNYLISTNFSMVITLFIRYLLSPKWCKEVFLKTLKSHLKRIEKDRININTHGIIFPNRLAMFPVGTVITKMCEHIPV